MIDYKNNPNERPKHWMPRKGDFVNYHAIIGEPVTSCRHMVTHVSTDSAGQPVAWITRKSGCVHCDALTPAGVGN